MKVSLIMNILMICMHVHTINTIHEKADLPTQIKTKVQSKKREDLWIKKFKNLQSDGFNTDIILESLTFLHFLYICFSEIQMQNGHQKHNITWRQICNLYFFTVNKHHFSWGKPMGAIRAKLYPLERTLSSRKCSKKRREVCENVKKFRYFLK